MKIQLDDHAYLLYELDFFEQSISELVQELNLKQEQIHIFGKTHDIPRLTAYQGEKPYTYSNILNPPRPYSPEILKIKSSIETYTSTPFNSVLINYYRDGNDAMGCHSDDEPELDHRIIASASFGAARKLIFKHKKNKSLKKEIILEDRSLLIMVNAQDDWMHAINRSKKIKTPRLNLTYRVIR